MSVLKNTKPDETADFLRENPQTDRAFSSYMREMLKKKGKKQQDIFNAAGISYGYGYKVISGEKRTRQRDLILEICIEAGFSLEETQKALRLYEMAELYPKIPRDAVIIIALNQGSGTIENVNKLLTEHGFPALYQCGE